MTYFLLKQQVWGRGVFTVSQNFSRKLEFDLPHKLRHFIFHAALIHFLKFIFKFSIIGKKHSFPMFDQNILMKFT